MAAVATGYGFLDIDVIQSFASSYEDCKSSLLGIDNHEQRPGRDGLTVGGKHLDGVLSEMGCGGCAPI